MHREETEVAAFSPRLQPFFITNMLTVRHQGGLTVTRLAAERKKGRGLISGDDFRLRPHPPYQPVYLPSHLNTARGSDST